MYPVPSTKLYEDYVNEFPIIKEHWLNKEFMIKCNDLSGYGRLDFNFFDFNKKIVKEIKTLMFCCKIPPLKELSGIKKILVYPVNRIVYSYLFVKLLQKIFFWKK